MPEHATTIGAIYDPKAFAFCSKAGIKTMNDKLMDLQDVRRGIEEALAEVDAAKDSVKMWAAVMLTTSVVKATCDSVLSVAAEFAGPLGKMINGTYKAADALADAGTKTALGQKVDWTDTGYKMTTGAMGAVSGYAGARSEVLKNVAGGKDRGIESIGRRGFENHVFSGEVGPGSLKQAAQTAASFRTANNATKIGALNTKIYVRAMTGDPGKLTREIFVGYLGEMATLSADYANNKVGKQAVAIGRGALEGGLKVFDAIQAFKRDSDTTAYDGIKKNLRAHLVEVSRKIQELDGLVKSCNLQLA